MEKSGKVFKAHHGILDAANVAFQHFKNSTFQEKKDAKKILANTRKMYITGHSLGGGMATILSVLVKVQFEKSF